MSQETNNNQVFIKLYSPGIEINIATSEDKATMVTKNLVKMMSESVSEDMAKLNKAWPGRYHCGDGCDNVK